MNNHYNPNQLRAKDGKWTDGPQTIDDKVNKKMQEEKVNQVEFKNDRVLYNGKDVGLGEIATVNDGVEIKKLYLNSETQKKGIGRLVMEKVFKDNPKADKILVYPSPSSEPYWARFASSLRPDGYFEITRDSFANGKLRYFKK